MTSVPAHTPRGVHPRHGGALASVSRIDRHAVPAEGPGQSTGQLVRLRDAQRRLEDALGRALTARQVIEIVARFDLTLSPKQGRPSHAYAAIHDDLGTAAVPVTELAHLVARITDDPQFAAMIETDVL